MAQNIFPDPNSIPPATSPNRGGSFRQHIYEAPAAEGQSLDPMVYVRAILRWKWAILFLALLTAFLTYGVVKMQKPIYTATTKLLLDSADVKTVGIQEIYDPAGSRNAQYINTQLEILKSTEVLNRVVDQLNLTTHPVFDPRQAKPGFIEQQIGKFVKPSQGAVELTDEQVRRSVIGQLRGGLSTSANRNSQILLISFSSGDPRVASMMANKLAEALIENELDAKFEMTQQANSWMNERLVTLKQNLTASEKQLQDFLDRKGFIDKSGVNAQATAQLTSSTSQLISAKAERSRLAEAYRRVRGIGNDLAELKKEPVIARTGTVISALGALKSAQRTMTEVSDRYGPEHPTYQKADVELRSAQTVYDQEVQLAAAQIQKEYETAVATVQAIEQTVAQAKGQVRAVNRSEFQLTALEREVESNRQLYNMFLARLKESDATDGMQKTMGRIFEPAVNASQTFPKPNQYTVSAFALALLLGMGFAVLGVILDSTVKTSEDVERKLRSPVLGTVPLSKKGGRGVTTILEEPMGIFAEAFRTVRTGLQLSELDSDRIILAVTSSIPGEGKSTVSANLAMVQSQTKKTLLIDADMRRPSLGKDLLNDTGRDRRQGLSDLISGQATAEEVIRTVPNTSLACISAGSVAPNPLDLLTSLKFNAVLEQLKQTYEVIVIDTPPVRLVSDALVIGERCSSLLYVVQSDKTPYKLAQRGLSEVRKVGIRVLGVVLNRQDLKKADRYYGEYSGYKGYGYKSYYGADRAQQG